MTLTIVLITAVVSFVGGILFVLFASFLTPPSRMDDESNWTLLRSVRMIADPSEGEVDASVYVFEYRDAWLIGTPQSMFQNRIVLSRQGQSLTFTWREPFAAFRCEILDLDGDGAAEFVLVSQELTARVVSYRGGHFTFRKVDELLAPLAGVKIQDNDHDGHVEFLVDSPVPGPAVMQWSRERGFYEAPRTVREFYGK